MCAHRDTRYYDAAYMALLDLVPTARSPLRLTELKVVGQYINFKVRAPMHLDGWGREGGLKAADPVSENGRVCV